jgi:(p)ppGpp synthase/HD superfamily hydrolase
VRASLSTRFVDAVNEARRLHPGGWGSADVPEMAHLLGVCALVLEDGGGEDEAVAALLHDAAEDAGGRQRLELIRFRFGERVARIVAGCTDSLDNPKPPWRARKEAFLQRIEAEDDRGVLLVCLADKVDNGRALVADHRELGDELWRRRGRSPEDQLWYSRAMADLFAKRRPGRLAAELGAVVDELERRVRG